MLNVLNTSILGKNNVECAFITSVLVKINVVKTLSKLVIDQPMLLFAKILKIIIIIFKLHSIINSLGPNFCFTV